ncbi:MAG: hypothetical protein MUF15_15185 [Acidobacteria bacterium]|nr:hypothetical protein [Acidobacteriota bacterium]
MLTRLKINNFKRFDQIDIELGSNVVIIGTIIVGKLRHSRPWHPGKPV